MPGRADLKQRRGGVVAIVVGRDEGKKESAIGMVTDYIQLESGRAGKRATAGVGRDSRPDKWTGTNADGKLIWLSSGVVPGLSSKASSTAVKPVVPWEECPKFGAHRIPLSYALRSQIAYRVLTVHLLSDTLPVLLLILPLSVSRRVAVI